MPKVEAKTEYNNENPFLTDKADALWERLDKGGKPLSKEELLKRAKALKDKSSKK